MSWHYRGPDLVRPEAGGTITLASDADRDAAVRVLNEAFAEGRLTADEHGDRVRACYVGRTWQELARLTADLPGPAASPGQADAAGRAVAGTLDGLDRCLLCAVLVLCPPAGIAWLLVARHRWRAGQRQALGAASRPAPAAAGSSFAPGSPEARAGDGRRAEDR
jgi:hypothetical protein